MSYQVGQPITVENGAFCVHGHVLAEPVDDMVRVSLIGNPLNVPLAQVSAGRKPKPRVGNMVDFKEELTRTQKLQDAAAQIVQLAAERDALAEVVAMQCDALAELFRPRCTHEYPHVHPNRALPAGGEVKPKDPAVNEWYEGLVDVLELYLLRVLGTRRPVSISDVDLRRLVQHILD